MMVQLTRLNPSPGKPSPCQSLFFIFPRSWLSSVAGYSRTQQDVPHVHKRGTGGSHQGHLDNFCADLTEVLWCSLHTGIMANVTAAWLLFFSPEFTLFTVFLYFFSSVNSGYTIISTILYMTQNISTCSGVKKKLGVGGMCFFFVTNQYANKIVVEESRVVWLMC